MDYEKSYKESLARARKYKNGEIEHDLEIGENIMEYVFPELKDSKDERIRKCIIRYIMNSSSYLLEQHGVTKEDAINWLEKQAEHANFRNKIQVGDMVIRNEDGVLVNLSQLDRIAKQDKNNMGISEATKQELKDNLNKALEQETAESWNEFIDEQKPADIKRLLQAEYKKSWDKALLQLPKEVDSQIWQIANNSAKTWEQSFAILCATQKAYDKGRKDALREQNPADKVKPKFHEGEWVIDYQGIVHQIANVVENVTNHTHGYDTVDGGYFNDNTEGVRLWTIQDAKDGDVLVSKFNQPFIYNGNYDAYNVGAYCGIVCDGSMFIETNNVCQWADNKKIKPATKEQRDVLFQKMHEAGYTFDFEKKELKKIEENPAWKPSDEQIRELSIAATGKGWFNTEILSELLEQLKKLKEGKL